MTILKGLNVIEISGHGAAAMAGKHFADWGATVTILEPAGGTPLRNAPPYYEKDGVQKSATWEWLSRGKTALRVGEGAKLVVEDARRWCENADLVLVETELTSAVLGLKPAEVKPHFAGKTTCVLIAPFATDGPYADYQATDLGINAMGGWMGMLGEPGRAPVRPAGRNMISRVGGLFALVSALIALRHLRQGGTPQFIDLSLQAVAASMITSPWMSKSMYGLEVGRRGYRWPHVVMECSDGYVGCQPLTATHWEMMCQMMGIDDAFEEIKAQEFNLSPELAARLYERVKPWLKQHTRAEIVAMAQTWRLPAAPVETLAERLECPQLAARGFFTTAEIDGKTVKVPHVAYSVRGVEPVERKALRESETVEIVASSAAPTSGKAPERPFEGLRVLALTWFWSGPYAMVTLGAHGADVIKVESIQRPDPFRFTSAPMKMERWYERGPLFNDNNTSQRGITLDLSSKTGKELFQRLVAQSDVVVSNYANRVMPNLGLTNERLLEINPRIIAVTMPGYGPGGPWEEYVGYAVAFEQMIAAEMTGYPDGLPIIMGGACDPIAGIHAAVAIELALLYREKTGKGTAVEVPQCEIFDSLFAPEHIAIQHGAPVPGRRANKHEWMAPHNAYRVAGDDQWFTIAVSSDEEFAALAKVLGLDGLERDSRFATVAARKQNEEALDAIIAAAVEDKDGVALERDLQAASVKGLRVIKPFSLPEDPGMQHIGFFQTLTREVTGTHPQKVWPFRFTSINNSHTRPSPLLGEHTREVLTELLGLSDEDLARLKEERVIGDKPLGLAG